MSKNKYIKAVFLILNLFVPGSANIAAGSFKLGSALVVLSYIIFFSIPYVPLLLVRALYLLLLLISYINIFLFKEEKTSVIPGRYIIIVMSVFIVFSIFSLNLTHIFMAGKSSNNKNGIVYVLGTKPFKKESMQKMLNMSDEDLFNLFDNNIHPFFRRLKAGIKKVGENKTLIISAGKNQKNITQRILQRVKKDSIFFSCKSTKEEVTALKNYIIDNDLNDVDIIMVSDDYHAFRALLYSKLSNINGVRFSSTSYEYSINGFIKIYLMEQLLFLFYYITSPINLFLVII
jgi:hypothetical protein